MEYRIVVETEVSGLKWYYVQKKYLFYFWRYLCEVRDLSMSLNRVGFSTQEEAEEYIQYNIDSELKKQQAKVIKREYIHK